MEPLTSFSIGGSNMGTLQAPTYQPFLTNNVSSTPQFDCFGFLFQNMPLYIAWDKSVEIYCPYTLASFHDIYLSSNATQPIVNGWPWGSKTTSNSDPYTGLPNTGVIRKYEFTVARGTIAPDGYSKDMLLINGQYPGVSSLMQCFD